MFKPGQLPTQIPPQHPAAMNIIQAANRMGMVGLTPNYLPKPDMPLHLQFLFQPRPLLVYVKPMKKNKCRQLDGFASHDNLANCMNKFEEVFDQSEEENEDGEKKSQKVIMTSQGIGLPQKKKIVYRDEKIRKHKEFLKEEIKKWIPTENDTATSDPYKTLFIARISYETTEKRLKKEFEIYGPIKTIKLIRDNVTTKSKGYCFIEYEHKRDFITAYKQADGKKIDGRRVLVDCERARVVKSWKPRRLGGGKGETRKGKDDYIIERMSRSRTRSKSHHHKEKDKKKKLSREKSKDRKKPQDRHRHREKGKEKDIEKDKKREKRDKDKDRQKEKEDKQNNEDILQQQQQQEPSQGDIMEIEVKNNETINQEKVYTEDKMKEESMKTEQKEDKKRKKKHKDKERKKDKKDESDEEEPKEKHKKHKHKKRKDKLKETGDEQLLEQGQDEDENKEREEGEQDVAEVRQHKHKSKHHHHSKKRKDNDEEEENDAERKDKKKHKHHKEKDHKKKKENKEKRKHDHDHGSHQFIEQEYTADQQG